MTLGELIKSEGRTQKWVREQLESRGITRSKSHFNEWCNNHRAPKDEYIYATMSEILSKGVDEIKGCFSQPN